MTEDIDPALIEFIAHGDLPARAFGCRCIKRERPVLLGVVLISNAGST